MESGHGSGNGEYSQIPPEATTIGEGNLVTLGKNLDSSPSSSSDTSFDEDFFLLDTSESPRKSSVGAIGPLKLDEDAHLIDGKKDVPGYASHRYELSNLGLPGPIFPPDVSARTPESSLHSMSAQQSPPIQVMEQSNEPVPYRIPSTVFARTKSTTPVEWSVASNESLFSIHMGNNSFSRDQIFLMRSGELYKSGELFTLPNTKSGELINFPSGPPSATAVAVATADQKSLDLGDGLAVAEAAAETMKEVLRATAEDRNKERTVPVEGACLSTSISHRSDGSGASIVSFAFPILTAEGGKSDSVNVDPEQQSQPQSQPQPQTPGTTPDAAENKWFPCFSCLFCR